MQHRQKHTHLYTYCIRPTCCTCYPAAACNCLQVATGEASTSCHQHIKRAAPTLLRALHLRQPPTHSKLTPHTSTHRSHTLPTPRLPPYRAPHSPDSPPVFVCAAPPTGTPATAAAAPLLRSSAAPGPLLAPLPLTLLRPAVTACMEGLGPKPGAGSMAGLAAKGLAAAAAAGAPDCDWWKNAAGSYGCSGQAETGRRSIGSRAGKALVSLPTTVCSCQLG